MASARAQAASRRSVAVAAPEAHDPEARAEALLGVGPATPGSPPRARPWRVRSAPPQATSRPASTRMAAVGLGHVLGRRSCGAPLARCAGWLATRRPRWKTSTARGRDPDVDALADELIGHAVVVAVDLDVVVDVDRGLLPGRVLVGRRGQRSQRRPVELPRTARAGDPASFLNGRSLSHASRSRDRGVRLGEAEERAVAQRGEDPALGDQDAGLDLRLVPGLARPGRDDRARRSGRPSPRRSRLRSGS